MRPVPAGTGRFQQAPNAVPTGQMRRGVHSLRQDKMVVEFLRCDLSGPGYGKEGVMSIMSTIKTNNYWLPKIQKNPQKI